MAGATPVVGLDMWRLAADAYQLNFPQATTYRMRASSLRPQCLLDEVGDIDLLLASPECTSHSVAKGNREGCEKSRGTAFEVVRFAKVLRPRWIVVENVMQMRRWKRYTEWLTKLRSLGYHITTGILDARYFSTPQSRRRLFVVGDLEAEPTLPTPTRPTSRTVSGILGRGESKQSPWRLSRVDIPDRATATIERADRAIESLGARTPFIMVYYGNDGAGGFQRLDRPLRTVTTLDRFAYVRPNGDGHEMRMLQPTELAAAMGFPATHKLPQSSRREKIERFSWLTLKEVFSMMFQRLLVRMKSMRQRKLISFDLYQRDAVDIRRFVDPQ